MTKYNIVIQFRNRGDIGTLEELDWRNEQEAHYDHLLQQAGLGHCNGGQAGAGTMEIFLIPNNLKAAVDLVLSDLTDRELIGWAKVASIDDVTETWQVHYPPLAEFSFWEF